MSISSGCCNWLVSWCSRAENIQEEDSGIVSAMMSHNSIDRVQSDVKARYLTSNFPQLELSRTPLEPSSVSPALSSVNAIPSDVIERYALNDFQVVAERNSFSLNEDVPLYRS